MTINSLPQQNFCLAVLFPPNSLFKSSRDWLQFSGFEWQPRWNSPFNTGLIMREGISIVNATRYQKWLYKLTVIMLPPRLASCALFTGLFHKDCSSLVRSQCRFDRVLAVSFSRLPKGSNPAYCICNRGRILQDSWLGPENLVSASGDQSVSIQVSPQPSWGESNYRKSRYVVKCISLITKIVNDKDHYLHNLITVMPHGHLRAIKCTTERSRKTFLPVAVKLFNAK